MKNTHNFPMCNFKLHMHAPMSARARTHKKVGSIFTGLFNEE